MPELVRGKAGRVFGHLQALLTIMKGLPLAYNRDLQEDKVPLFDTVDTVKTSVRIMAEVIHGMQVRRDRMLTAAQDGFMNATDLADYLVERGIPFAMLMPSRAGSFAPGRVAGSKNTLPRSNVFN